MSDVVSQLEAVIAGIEQRIPHTVSISGLPCEHECVCDYAERVRTEIARTVERMLSAARYSGPGNVDAFEVALAAAFRATQEQERA